MRVFYICDRNNHCPDPCREECVHTRNPKFSINFKESIPSLEELNDGSLFESHITSDGIAEFWERETNSL